MRQLYAQRFARSGEQRAVDSAIEDVLARHVRNRNLGDLLSLSVSSFAKQLIDCSVNGGKVGGRRAPPTLQLTASTFEPAPYLKALRAGVSPCGGSEFNRLCDSCSDQFLAFVCASIDFKSLCFMFYSLGT